MQAQQTAASRPGALSWLPGRAARGRAGGRKAPKSKRVVEGLLNRAGVEIDGLRPWDIQVHNEGFYGRVLAQGSLGLGEGYMEGWWDARRVDQLICKIAQGDLERYVKDGWKSGFASLKARLFNLQTLERAPLNAKAHYDLGVEFFAGMLGPTMAYSCAYWKHAQNLNQAQEDKLDLICRKLQVKRQDKVLDVGCGWGSLLKHAARELGCSATGVTISQKQYHFARDSCRDLPVRILLSDYRAPDLGRAGPFDKIACVGMFEHVGRKNYRQFMGIIHDILADGGLFLLQTVGRNRSSGATEPWADKHIFPNGMLPSLAEVARAAEGLLVIEDCHNFGADYDRTLMAWHENFERFAKAGGSSLDRRFYRMWRYYLLSFAGNFRARRGPQLWQIVMSKNGVAGGYQSVR